MRETYSIRHGLKDRPFLDRLELNDRLRSRLEGPVLELVNLHISSYGGRLLGPWNAPLVHRLWDDYFALSVSQYPDLPDGRELIRGGVEQFPAHTLFDVIELLLEISDWPENIIERINFVFEREGSVHRVVGGEIVDRMDSEEISEVEAALALPKESIKRHIRQALRLLKGEDPNYGASMAQSILAVETAVNVILGEQRTLGEGLSELERRGFPMHGAFKSALSKLYGFTSDADGIRHGKTGEGLAANGPNARFLLVVCSAFVNFLLGASDQSAPVHE